MQIYFSTTTLQYGLYESLVEMDVRNMLFSYEYRSNYNDWLNLIKHLNKPNVMIDSGAFSAWTINKPVNREKYLEFIYKVRAEFTPYVSNIFYVNLDMIPGEFGRKPTSDEIEQSAQKGLDNYYWFKEKGITTIHVFHQHEDFKWLEKLMALEPYIGISPANDLTTKSRLPWLYKCFSIVKDKNKTHCFGGTSKDILYQVPFYSADSSSYAISRKFSPRWHGTKVGAEVKNKNITFIIKKKIKEEIREKLTIEHEATLLWKQRGINLN